MLITLPNAFGDAATNMAIDAALLENMPVGLAVFRHYGWLEPAATFGYAQRYQEVAITLAASNQQIESPQALDQEDSGYALCRRITGGGIVDHRNDWTYALIIHSSLPCAATPATTLYLQLHQAIQSTLRELGVESQLAPCPRQCSTVPAANHVPSQCFITSAANDVLQPDGRKIAGAAMKRNRNGLLIQGSVDRGALPEAFDYATFQQELNTAIAAELKLPTGELEDIRPLFQSELIEREKKRFASAAWNQKR